MIFHLSCFFNAIVIILLSIYVLVYAQKNVFMMWCLFFDTFYLLQFHLSKKFTIYFQEIFPYSTDLILIIKNNYFAFLLLLKIKIIVQFMNFTSSLIISLTKKIYINFSGKKLLYNHTPNYWIKIKQIFSNQLKLCYITLTRYNSHITR